MSARHDEDDKPTIVLDLNALKKQKLKQEEDLSGIVTNLQFSVDQNSFHDYQEEDEAMSLAEDSSEELVEEVEEEIVEQKIQPKVILFDFESDFFESNMENFPSGYDYHIARDLSSLNKLLTKDEDIILVFNYDVASKAVNQLCAQVKKKFPNVKTIIMAKNISPEKAHQHSLTKYGAHGYYQYPLEASRVEVEFEKVLDSSQKAA